MLQGVSLSAWRPMEKLCQGQDERDFDEFRRLEINKSDLNPPLGPRADDAIDKHRHEKEERHRIDDIGEVRVKTVFDKGDRDHQCQTDEQPEGLFEIDRRAGDRPVGRDAVQVEDPDGGDEEDHPHERPIEMDEKASINHTG